MAYHKRRKKTKKKGKFRRIKDAPNDPIIVEVDSLPVETEHLDVRTLNRKTEIPKPKPLRQSFQTLLNQLITPKKEGGS